MTRGKIVETLREAMRESSTQDVNWDVLTEATTIESLGFDSLSILDLVYEVQQKFGVEFEAEKLVSIRTVGDLVSFIETQV